MFENWATAVAAPIGGFGQGWRRLSLFQRYIYVESLATCDVDWSLGNEWLARGEAKRQPISIDRGKSTPSFPEKVSFGGKCDRESGEQGKEAGPQATGAPCARR